MNRLDGQPGKSDPRLWVAFAASWVSRAHRDSVDMLYVARSGVTPILGVAAPFLFAALEQLAAT